MVSPNHRSAIPNIVRATKRERQMKQGYPVKGFPSRASNLPVVPAIKNDSKVRCLLTATDIMI